jgi:protein required for attachment to host cells
MDRWNIAVVIDRSQARFFNRRPFQLFETMENENGRSKNKDFTTDKPGISRAKGGGPASTHSLGSEKDPKQDSDQQFVNRLCEQIGKVFYEQKPESILLVAEPKMKGLVKAKLNGECLKKSHWLDKDYAHFDEHDLKARLSDWTP